MKVKLVKTSFGWYGHGFEIRKSTIAGCYNIKSVIIKSLKTRVVGMKRVREYIAVIKNSR